MLRSQSDFSARNHPIDQSFRPFEPTKRVNRPFYVPELVNDMERVFSEYDWKNHRFTSTLRPISQSRQPASASTFPPCTAASNSTMVSKKEDRRHTYEDQVSTSRLPFLPTHISRGAADEGVTSSYLLSSASSPSSASPTSKRERRSPCYASSPISQTDVGHSPLQQSIIANANLNREVRLPSTHTYPVENSQETQHQPQFRGARAHPQVRRVTIDEKPSGRNKQKETTPAGRTRSSTWSSDVTAVGVSDYASEKKEKSSAFRLESEEMMCGPQGTCDSPHFWPARQTSEAIWTSPIRRRRSLMRSHSAFARLDHIDRAGELGFEEEEEEGSAEETQEQHRENRLSSIFSAIHYQYVSVGLRIQLAVHRTEKKVTRKLSNKRKSRHSDFL